METLLTPSATDPLEAGRLRCAARAPMPILGQIVDEQLEVDDELPGRLRLRLASLAPERRPTRIVLAPAGGVDPFGPDPYLQSAAFLTAAAALEAGVGVALVTRGLPARGFEPLFARYPGQAVAQVAVSTAPFEPAGAARWSARLAGIEALASAGVPVWLRLDPAVPSRTDSDELLAEWLGGAAAAGAVGAVVVPLVFNSEAQELIGDDPAVIDYYRPGRRRKRGVLPAPPVPHLPLERETALAWRVRTVAEDFGLTVRLCRCDRGVPGSCGLLPARRGAPSAPPIDDRQLPLFAG